MDQLAAEAQDRNPAVAAAAARADAASASVDAVRTWEDPMMKLGLDESTPRGMPASQTGNIVYGVEQKLPVFGQPGLTRRVAEADAAKEQANVAYESQALRRDLTTALAALALADRSVELAQEDLGWIQTLLDAVDHRYKVGQSSQVEWLKVQTEQAKALDHLKSLEVESHHWEAELNRLLNRDLAVAWPRVKLPAIQPAVPYTDELINAAMRSEPKLKVMQQEIVAAQAAVRLTRRQRLPEVGIGLEARQYSGDGGIRDGALMLNFSVPWLNGSRYDSDIRRSEALVRVSEREADDYTLTIRRELHRLTSDLDDARRQALLYRDKIIPLTEQTLNSARAAWENNLGLFQDVLDTHRMLLDNQLTLAQATATQLNLLAELTLMTGVKDPTAFAAPANSAPLP
ncbi:MAG TPA: TolC family protein [Opitutaceae bacterium]|nr:TolC family protein [Opitutaceae bacterium]